MGTEGPFTPDEFYRLVRESRPIYFVNSSTLMHREAVLALGGYREHFAPAEDLDLWIRMAGQGHLMLKVPEPLLFYRMHGASLTMTQNARQRLLTRWAIACGEARVKGLPEPSYGEFMAREKRRPARERARTFRRETGERLYQQAALCYAEQRKLKEILFEIVGEINLDILKYSEKDYELPITISSEDIKTKYFKDKHEIKHKKIHTESRIGVINGLWANAFGRGGVIPIQVGWRPSQQFHSLQLTGMQGVVMKESMNVALTLAWDLTPYSTKKDIRDEHSLDTNVNGVHIHCPEGATPKDGPSAGTAITTAIYSMLNKKKIKYNIAITGEICLNLYTQTDCNVYANRPFLALHASQDGLLEVDTGKPGPVADAINAKVVGEGPKFNLLLKRGETRVLKYR